MGLVIPQANAMHFILNDGNLPNVQNTLVANEKYASWKRRGYCQKWQHDDVVTVQVVSDTATTPTVQVFGFHELTPLTPTLKTSYAATGDYSARYYWEFSVNFATYPNQVIYLKVTQGAVEWESELQSNGDLDDDLEQGYLLKFEYTNKDQPSALPNFLVDYTTDISFFFYVEAIVRLNGVIGDDEVYINVDERTLVESQIFKTRQLKTQLIPEFMTDKITISGKHFVFMVNDLRYTTDGNPSISEIGSNLKILEWTIVHGEILGFDTDDKGLKTGIAATMSLREDALNPATPTKVTIPGGYIVHALFCNHNAGSAADYKVKLGWTSGAQDIVPPITNIPLGGARNKPIDVHEYPAFSGDYDVYLETVGVGSIADILIHLVLA